MNMRFKLLAVDDEAWNLDVIEACLVPQGYDVVTAQSADEALKKIGEHQFSLILTDIMMPGKDGLQLCREIKKQKQYQSIPIILVTALQETIDKVNGLEAGAADFISKPVDSVELGARIRAHLRVKTLMDEIETWNVMLEQKVRERTYQLDQSYFQTIEALIMALDLREKETGKHSLRVAFYTAEMGRLAGIRGRELEEIAMGALLHDIGKIGIPDRILLKPGQLSPEEWIEMRKHPAAGWEMIKDIEFIGKGREVVLAHQERWNGSGYPRKLKGEEIYIGARIFAVVDTFDVLMSERSYKKVLPYGVSRNIIKNDSGVLFDARAADLFLSVPPSRWLEIKDSVERSDFRALIRQIREEGPGPEVP